MELFLTKEVDRSLLRQGMTIPLVTIGDLKQMMGVDLQKGQKFSVNIKLKGEVYTATLTSVDHSGKYANREDWQIRYSEKSDIAQALRGVFANSWEYLQRNKTDDGKQTQIPDGIKESVDIYISDNKEIVFECKTIPRDPFFEFLNYLGAANTLSGYVKSYKLTLVPKLILVYNHKFRLQIMRNT